LRGDPGGWHDIWDDPDDHAQLQARDETTKRQQTRHAAVLGVVWQGEIQEQQVRKRRG
jgi:hypothetical protein